MLWQFMCRHFTQHNRNQCIRGWTSGLPRPGENMDRIVDVISSLRILWLVVSGGSELEPVNIEHTDRLLGLVRLFMVICICGPRLAAAAPSLAPSSCQTSCLCVGLLHPLLACCVLLLQFAGKWILVNINLKVLAIYMKTIIYFAPHDLIPLTVCTDNHDIPHWLLQSRFEALKLLMGATICQILTASNHRLIKNEQEWGAEVGWRTETY